MNDRRPGVEPRRPEQLLADWQGDAQVLRARGHTHDAEVLERCASEMQAALGPYLTWLSEPEARLKSGRGIAYFRSQFAQWTTLGLAELRGRQRYYRAAIVPQRAHASAARLAGLRGERAG